MADEESLKNQLSKSKFSFFSTTVLKMSRLARTILDLRYGHKILLLWNNKRSFLSKRFSVTLGAKSYTIV